MDDYSVLIEVRAQAAPDLDVDAALSALLDRLDAEGLSPAVSGSPDTWSARIFVPGNDAVEAAEHARVRALMAASTIGLPTYPVVRAEAVREDVLDEDLASPQLPDLVSTPEVAEILGVSPQRIHTLAGDGRLPEPWIDRPGAKLWIRAAIDKFNREWDRKPGRPRNVA